MFAKLNGDGGQIGKTSSLVLTLCGVLKDIILVALSIAIYGTTVTPLQFFGYSVALAGLVWYKAGGDKLLEQYTALKRSLVVRDGEDAMTAVAGGVRERMAVAVAVAVVMTVVVLLLWRGPGALG